MNDIQFLKQTLKLAQKGLSWTNPNPLVGAVIVKNNQIIGQGFHHQAGSPHAEIEALNKCSNTPAGATLYVNLEPCVTFGKTPPCADAIIRSKIKKVVCSTLDPNPKNYHKGITKLQKAGIETVSGILKNEACKLNEAFFAFHQKRRPFVALKFASSLDGKLATASGDSKWITNEKARAYARRLRAKYQAILVGINTVVCDDPCLTARIKNQKDPIRIILDPRLQIPFKAKALNDQNVILVTGKTAKTKQKQLETMGYELLNFDSERITIPKLLEHFKKLNIISILVEGGGETLGGFIDEKMFDKVYAFHSPLIIGGGKAVAVAGKGASNISESIRLKDVSFKKFGDNLLTIGYT